MHSKIHFLKICIVNCEHWDIHSAYESAGWSLASHLYIPYAYLHLHSAVKAMWLLNVVAKLLIHLLVTILAISASSKLFFLTNLLMYWHSKAWILETRAMHCTEIAFFFSLKMLMASWISWITCNVELHCSNERQLTVLWVFFSVIINLNTVNYCQLCPTAVALHCPHHWYDQNDSCGFLIEGFWLICGFVVFSDIPQVTQLVWWVWPLYTPCMW